MKSNWKKLLSLALVLALMLGFAPGMDLTAQADDSYASLKNTTTVVKFDGKDWYLIDYDESTVTLLSNECVGASVFNPNEPDVNTYSGSTVESFVNSWYRDYISKDAKAAVDGNGMFLLTKDQATALSSDVLKCSQAPGAYSNHWWLCSPGNTNSSAVGVDGDNGNVPNLARNVWVAYGVRPALKLNLESVIFSSEQNTFEPAPAAGGTATEYAALVNTTTTVTFNNMDWYVIADDSTAADAGTVTLLAKDPIGASKFNNADNDGNGYHGSVVENYLKGLTNAGGAFAGVADAIAATDLSDVGVTAAKLYLLSVTEANALSINIRKCSPGNSSDYEYDQWWLRSPGTVTNGAQLVHSDDGTVHNDINVKYNMRVRPALRLDLSKVTFSNNTFALPVLSVASVTSGGTTTEYAAFSDAVNEWNNAANNATLKLLSDVTTITINFSGTKTLDLNGHSLTGNGNGTVIKVNGGSLTVNGKNGTITGGKAGEGGAFFITSNGKVTLNDCTLKGNEATNVGDAFFIQSSGGGGSAIINNCTIIGRGKDKGAALWLQGHNNPDTSFTMNGGSISNFKIGVWVQGKTDLGTSMFTMNGGTISDNLIGVKNEGPNSKVIVSGDAIISNNDEKNLELNDGIKVTVNSALGKNAKIGIYMGNSGVFTNSTPTDYNDATKFTSDNASYAVGKNSSGQLELRVPPAASVTSGGTTTEYTAFADAVSAWNNAANGATLKLLSDVTTSTINASGTKTLDLNEHTLSGDGNGSVIFINGATLTVNDGTITGGTGGKAYGDSNKRGGAVDVKSGTITLNNCTINGNTADFGSAIFMAAGVLNITGSTSIMNHSGTAIWIQGATVNMDGGTISNNGKGVRLFSSKSYSDIARLNISGGRISENGYGVSFEGDQVGHVSVSGNAVIANNTGSNLSLQNEKISIADALGNDASIGITMKTPGVFTDSANTTFNDPTKFVSDNAGYAVFKNSSGQLELRVPPAASVTSGVTTTEYMAFSDALTEWADGSTLTLLSDVTTGSTISVSGTKTLDLNGHGIRKTGSGSVINVGGASLTLNDSAPNALHKYTIQNPKSNGAGLAVVDDANGTQTFTGGYITGGNTDDRGGGVVVNGGSLIMNGGTVIGNNAANHGGGVALKELGGTFIMNGGALIGNTGKYGGGLSMINGSRGTVNGGKIQYNCTSKNGGGIHTDGAGHRASLTVTGGTITNNYCDGDTVSGGGVLVSGMTFNLSGSVEIKDNLRKSGADNLCLIKGNTVIVADTLSNSTPIGVTMQKPGVFTNTASDKVSYNDAAKFVSDDAGYAVSQNSSNQLELVPTVTFDANGGEGTMAEQTVSHDTAVVLMPNAFTHADYTFAGWNTQADGMGTPYADGASVTLTAPLTLYAQWTSKPLYTVSGTVKQKNTPTDTLLSGVTLQLVQGEKKIAVTATNAAGEFSFSAPDGIYNIVAEYSGKTKTELVTLNANQQVVITMPSENVNSTLTVTGSEIKNVMVGGLDELAEANSASGQAVTVTMTVEEKENAANKTDIETVAAQEHPNQSLDCIEIKIEKTVDSATTTMESTNKVLEIVVPYRFTGKENVEVYRYHDSAAKLNKLDSKPSDSYTDGTYYPDKANGLIYIYADKFSTYAIGYTQCYNITGPISYGSFNGTVTVSLLDDGAEKYTTTANLTDGAGAYSFTHVLEGTYTLRAVWTEDGKETALQETLNVW